MIYKLSSEIEKGFLYMRVNKRFDHKKDSNIMRYQNFNKSKI